MQLRIAVNMPILLIGACHVMRVQQWPFLQLSDPTGRQGMFFLVVLSTSEYNVPEYGCS